MALTIIEGKVWKFGDNINTDVMMPGLTLTSGLTAQEKASYCMQANRPEFAKSVRPGDVIVGGKNFGCGSSRAAAENFLTLKMGCAIAESFGRIFFRISINLGFPLLACPGIAAAFNEGDRLRAEFTTGEITNLTTGKKLKAEPLPEVARRVLEMGGMVALLKQEYSK